MSLITDIEEGYLEPEFWFNEITPNPKKRYTIYILNIRDEKVVVMKRGSQSPFRYAVYRARLEKGFERLYVSKTTIYRFHFPKTGLDKALTDSKTDRSGLCKTRGENERKLDGVYDCRMTFIRKTPRNIIITKKEYLKAK